MPGLHEKTSEFDAILSPRILPGALAASFPRSLSDRFDPVTLAGQFVLAHKGIGAPSLWPGRRIRDWELSVHPGLPVSELVTSDGVSIGWIVGYAIEPAGRMLGARVFVPLRFDATPGEFESFLYRHGGRFIAVLLSSTARRVYLDPLGSLGAVYSPAHGLVAATTSLIPYSLGCEDDLDLIMELGVPRQNGVFPFGLTPRRNVSRLLPNHCLDLDTWRAQRHWPGAAIDEVVRPTHALSVVAETLRCHIQGVAADRLVYVSLTAGFDSRMIAACARPHLDRVRFVTLAIPDKYGELDCEIAKRLAERCSLDHEVIPFRKPKREDIDEWLWRTGCEVGERRGLQATAMYHRLDPLRAELTGEGGELARAGHWRRGVKPSHVVVAELLDSLDIPATPRLLELADDWLTSLPTSDMIRVYDLLHIEQWLGCWGGVIPYGDATAVAYRIYPLAHRDAIDAMIRLPRSYKLSRRFPRDLIQAEWPELMTLPVNRRPGPRHYLHTARRRVWLLRQTLQQHGLHI